MKVIIAIDDSVHAVELVDEVSRRQWPKDVQFKILQVIEPISWADFDNDKWADVTANAHVLRHEDACRRCARARQKLEEKLPDSLVHFEIRQGNAKAEILDAAVEWSADKIVLGATGRGSCPRFILGSVSRTVATHAPCSVEIIRSSPAQEKSAAGKKATRVAQAATW